MHSGTYKHQLLPSISHKTIYLSSHTKHHIAPDKSPWNNTSNLDFSAARVSHFTISLRFDFTCLRASDDKFHKKTITTWGDKSILVHPLHKVNRQYCACCMCVNHMHRTRGSHSIRVARYASITHAFKSMSCCQSTHVKPFVPFPMKYSMTSSPLDPFD